MTQEQNKPLGPEGNEITQPDPGRPRRHIAYGTVVFLISAAVLVGLSFVQYHLGSWGLVITELVIALIAVLACKIRGIGLREAFPVGKPRKGEVLAALMLWLGTLLWTLLAAQIQLILFPKAAEVSRALVEAVQGTGHLALNLVVAAILPGICEELLFRGFFYRAFSTMRRRRYAVPLVGLLFGLFHMNLYRFVPTAGLGILLTYLIYRTGNILLPMGIHMLNNALAVIAGSLVSGEMAKAMPAAAPAFDGGMLLSILIFGSIGGLLIHRGTRRLDRAELGWPARLVRPEDEIVM